MEYFSHHSISLWGEYTGDRWIPSKKPSDAKFHAFLRVSLSKLSDKKIDFGEQSGPKMPISCEFPCFHN